MHVKRKTLKNSSTGKNKRILKKSSALLTVSISSLASEESMTLFGLLTTSLTLVFCTLVRQAASEVILITPDSNVPCTGQSCPMLTLSQFAADSSGHVPTNITLLFLSGKHYLEGTDLTLFNRESFVMKSVNSTAQIQCVNNYRMSFSQLQYSRIANLEFIGCGGHQMKHVQEFVINNTKFDGQGGNGSALELIETTAQIINSTFVSNRKGTVRDGTEVSTLLPKNPNVRVGGAIISKNSIINITNSRFNDNRAHFGGAIFAEKNSIINILSETVFKNNSATAEGAVLHSSSSTIFVKSSRFHNNTVSLDLSAGGVLSLYSSNIRIEKSDFRSNRANLGGVLRSYISNIIIESTHFHDNNAKEGGVLYATRGNVITIQKSYFHNNGANKEGGALYFSSTSTVTIEASGFHNNSANEGGGVLRCESSTITIATSNFHNNNAAFGGVLDRSRGGIVTIKTSHFCNNSAIVLGGVVYCSRALRNSIMAIEASNFYSNNASVGGVLYTDEGTVRIKTSHFHNNSAISQGGVLYCGDECIVEASNFYNNNAKYGGVLLSSESTITIGSSNFTANRARIGAVINACSNSGVQCQNRVIIDSNAAEEYGVIYLRDSPLNADNSSSIIVSNNVGSLVAIRSDITFNGCARFENNLHLLITANNDYQNGTEVTLLNGSNVIFNEVCNTEIQILPSICFSGLVAISVTLLIPFV